MAALGGKGCGALSGCGMKSKEETAIPVATQRPHPTLGVRAKRLGVRAKRQRPSSPEKSGVGCYHACLLLAAWWEETLGNFRGLKKKKKKKNLLD